MVGHGNGLNLAVGPWTVRKVQIPVHQHLGLLVLQRLDIVGVVYLAVRNCAAVGAQVAVLGAGLDNYHNTTVE